MAENKTKQVSYVESSSDQATSMPVLDIESEKEYLQQVRPHEGERTFPGESLTRIEDAGISQHGFLWADTPESSVFVRKKQWNDDGWNYAIEINPEKATQEEINKAIYSGEALNRKIRATFGNIITRKLEWLNDHEQFTKSSAALRSFLSQEDELPKIVQSYYTVENDGPDKPYQLLKEVVEKIASITLGSDYKKKNPNATIEIKAEIIELNDVILRDEGDNQDLNEKEYQDRLDNGKLKILEGTKLYYGQDDLFVHSDGSLSTASEELLLNLYAPTLTSDGAFTRYFLTQEKGPDDNITRTRFNGITEYANISSISTSVSLDGAGSAVLTLENPGNIMYISRDDIELALAEVEVEKDSNIAGLVYYRGRYYTSSVLNSILSKDYNDLDDQSKVNELTSYKTTKTKTIIEEKLHIVTEGETLSRIARDNGVTIEEILVATFKDKKKRAAFEARVLIVKKRPSQTSSKTSSSSTAAQAQSGNTSDDFNSIVPYADIFSSEIIPSSRPSSNKTLRGIDLIYPGEEFLIPIKKEVEVEVEVDKYNEEQKIRDNLRKYAMNHWIIEPVDHVWVWMTSPSKSTFILPSELAVIEAPDSIRAVELQSNELDEQLSIIDNRIGQIEILLKDSKLSFEKEETLNREKKTLEQQSATKNVDIKRLKEEVADLKLAKKEGRLSTDQITANRSDLLEDLHYNKELQNIVSETQGLAEQQFQVFEGVVSDVQENYSSGKYTLSVTCRDLFYFLEISRIMEKPGAKGTVGPKYELNNPIIEARGEEGEKPQGAWKTGMVTKYDEAVFSTQEKNTGQGQKEKTKKITATQLREQVGIFTTEKAFARTDAANVISMLILGIPYNVDLFIQNALIDGKLVIEEKKTKAASNNKDKTKTDVKGGKKKDTSTRKGSLDEKLGYFQIIKRMMGIQNDFLGDFKPFIPLSPEMLEVTRNEKLETLNKEILELETLGIEVLQYPPSKKDNEETVDLTSVGGGLSEKTNGPNFSQTLAEEYVFGIDNNRTKALSTKEWTNFKKTKGLDLKRKEKNSKKAPDASSQGRSVLEVLYAKRKLKEKVKQAVEYADSFLKDVSEEDKTQLSNILKERVTRREDIVRNQDDNYLVISSEYTFNSDIEAFNYMIGDLGNVSLWQSGYETPLNTCKRAAEVTNFDFFADENGNIRFEPPRYNRILQEHLPRLFGQPGVIGEELRKRFKSDSFQNYIKLLKGEPGTEGTKGLKELENEVNKTKQLTVSAVAFKEYRLIIQKDIKKNKKAKEEIEDKIKNLENALYDHSEIRMVTFGMADAAELFLYRRDSWINDIIIDETDEPTLVSYIEFYLLVKELKEQGEKYNPDDFIFIADNIAVFINDSIENYKTQVLTFEVKILELEIEEAKVQEDIDEIQNLEDNYFTAITNLDDRENELNKLTLSLNKEDPKLRDLTDDAKIHRIPDAIIITSQFKEAKPKFTRLDVSGEPRQVNIDVPEDLYYWAGGVDYDLWKTYGFIKHSVKLPYLNTGDVCKPYCAALLGRQWGQIFSGNITVRGDSKYKINDAVYIESKDMYFRIQSVSQSFTYGSSYQTTITLDYGRCPEFIIPDPWDLLGQTSLDATNNDYQVNVTTTPKEREENKVFEKKEEKTKVLARDVKKETKTTTTKKEEEKPKNSETVATTKEQVQVIPEAKENKEEQVKRDELTEIGAEITKLKRLQSDIEIQIIDLEDEQEELREQDVKLTKEIIEDDKAGKNNVDIMKKVNKRNNIRNQATFLESDISNLKRRLKDTEKKIEEKEEEKKKLVLQGKDNLGRTK